MRRGKLAAALLVVLILGALVPNLGQANDVGYSCDPGGFVCVNAQLPKTEITVTCVTNGKNQPVCQSTARWGALGKSLLKCYAVCQFEEFGGMFVTGGRVYYQISAYATGVGHGKPLPNARQIPTIHEAPPKHTGGQQGDWSGSGPASFLQTQAGPKIAGPAGGCLDYTVSFYVAAFAIPKVEACMPFVGCRAGALYPAQNLATSNHNHSASESYCV